MSLFNLFKKKKKQPVSTASQESLQGASEPKADAVPEVAEKEPQSAKPVEVAPAKAPAGVKKDPPTETAKAAKAAPVKKAAPKKPSAPAAIKVASEPARTSAPKQRASRPFFMATEEDIKAAFDQAIADAEVEISKNDGRAVGKYEFNLEVDGYHFYLVANNGQVLFDSPSFTTLVGALNGIKTFKKALATSEFDIKMDKYNRYRFILANKYYGENYTTKDQCQKCAESVRNFATNSRIIRYTPDKESLAAFELAKISKHTVDEVDWNAIAKAEQEAPKKGKFEIYRVNNEYSFYLLASNGQILYSSRYYSSENACRNGIESFKRAVYVGNFFVDRDKFGNYRYVLKNIGSAPSFIGESYDNKPQCEKIIDSVKNFVVTATVEEEITDPEGAAD